MAAKPRQGSSDVGAIFQLERFEWAAPDRLEVAGSFDGHTTPTGVPTLVVEGADGARQLDCVPVDGEDGGASWVSAFVWSGPPMPFDAARLDFGGGVSVELPAPGHHDERLEVHGAADERFKRSLEQIREAGEEALAEVAELRERVSALESELAQAKDALERARASAADADRLRTRLDAVRLALDDDR